jgi:hypothetical protein
MMKVKCGCDARGFRCRNECADKAGVEENYFMANTGPVQLRSARRCWWGEAHYMRFRADIGAMSDLVWSSSDDVLANP